jgi:hypothetical protein
VGLDLLFRTFFSTSFNVLNKFKYRRKHFTFQEIENVKENIPAYFSKREKILVFLYVSSEWLVL